MNSDYFRVAAIMSMVLLAVIVIGFFWAITPSKGAAPVGWSAATFRS